ncbi:MAG: class II aldolase/adducin family protein [Rhodobacterales bacterium]|nr:class II aldolase/adducin family protein [Rhodobacterales bacterium]
MKDLEARREVLATALKMNAVGINKGTSGNVSRRIDGGFLITPSGRRYEDCDALDVVEVALDGTPRGVRPPSSEWRFHRDIYAARPDAKAVVHTHSTYATTLACLRRAVPPFHYMVAVAGGNDIRLAPYATFGTQDLSDNALAALKDRKACLLANHGMIVLGKDLTDALARAVEVEGLCEVYWRTLVAGGPTLLTGDEMGEVWERFHRYQRGAGVDDPVPALHRTRAPAISLPRKRRD